MARRDSIERGISHSGKNCSDTDMLIRPKGVLKLQSSCEDSVSDKRPAEPAKPASARGGDDDDGDEPLAVLQDVLDDLRDQTDRNGPHHPTVGDLWNAVGLIRLHMQQDAVAAIECHRHALEIYRRQSGKDDESKIKLAVCLNDLGRCCELQLDTETALKLYREALEVLDSTRLDPKSCHRQSIERALARIHRS